MTTPKDGFWTDDRVAYLREMVASGAKYTASDMAWRLGATRNQIIGKTRRLGLDLDLPDHVAGRPRRSPKPKASPARVAPFKKPAIRVHQKRVFGGDQVEVAPEPPPLPAPSIDDAARDPASLKTLLELGADECRWAVTDGSPWLFCADPVQEGHPWCPAHCQRAYNPGAYKNALRPFAPARTTR